MSIFFKNRRSRLYKHACIFNDSTGSTEGGRIQYACCINTTGAVGRRLQHPVWRRDLIIEEVHRISNSIPFVADISMKRLHHHVNGLHHYYGVEGTTACQGSSWIHSIRCHSSKTITTSLLIERMKQMEHLTRFILDWSRRFDQSIQRSSAFPMHHKSWRSSYSPVTEPFSYKSNNNNNFQVFVKPATT